MQGEMSFTAAAPPVFDGSNYQIWAIRMQAYLEACDLWEAVEEDYQVAPLPSNPTMAQIKHHKDQKQRKSKAKACLFAAVNSSIFTRVMTLSTAKEIWDFIKAEYEGDKKIKGMQIMNLVREFEMQKMKESETIKEYSDRLLGIVNKVRLLGQEFSDARIIQKILVTLPERFESVISSLENSRDLTSITMAELLSALQAQEQRRLMRQEGTVEGALQAKVSAGKFSKWKKQKGRQDAQGSKAEFPPCQHCGKKGHAPFRCWKRPDVKCNKCKQMGHIAKICKSREQQKQDEEQIADQSEEQLFVAACDSSKSQWLIDSGCTNHMTSEKGWFKELDESYTSKVRVGNGECIAAKGKGSVVLTTTKGTRFIPDVLFVPDIKHNLLSVGQLLEKGFKLAFEDKKCSIRTAEGEELFSVSMKGKSFFLDLMEDHQALTANPGEVTELWHKRLGHYHHSALLQMKEMKMVEGLPVLENQLNSSCKACQLGKQVRQPFASSEWRASRKLELIHTDLGGPLPEPSLNGSRYYILFIDDLTRKCWIYFMKTKAEVADIFWNFKTWIENQSNCRIQKIRSDNGGEYTSDRFKDICRKAGITHQYTTAYTPQQNGVSERKNRTLMEMTRSLLHDKNLPKCLWAEAASTTTYLLNRLPTKAVEGKTPFEAWYGSKPSLANLKVFGCVCFTHVPQQRRDKLDKKAEPGVFVGYSNVSKAYRVFQPHTGKLIVSRDVHFEEEQIWNWDESEEAQVKAETSPPNQDSNLPNLSDVDDIPVRGTRSLAEIYDKCNVAVLEPANFREAQQDVRWQDAMKEELRMIEKNNTWLLVPRPHNKNVIGVKWIFKTKLNADGSINKHKARLVVKGYAQEAGLDYFDTFAPVARLETIRLLLAIAAQKGWKVNQLDVKSAFLNGFLQEEIYIEQPEGFQINDQEDKVYLLKKALYGLKQAPRAWYSRIDEYLLSLGFCRSLSEPTLYVKHDHGDLLIISIYVDDLLLTGSSSKLVDQLKEVMMKMFEMTDLGKMAYFLGMEIMQVKDGIHIRQEKYAAEVLKRFQMDKCKPMSTPMNQKERLKKEDGSGKADESVYRSLVGSLMYLTATRPDILHAVSILSRFLHCSTNEHFKAAKRVLRYVKGTTDYGVWFKRDSELNFFGYSDSDWAGSSEDMKSTSGYCFTLGSGMFSWRSKKQETVAQSTAEAEFVAATAATNQVLWIRKLLVDLQLEQTGSTRILVDNQAAISISNNPVFHGRTKHFNIKLYFLREMQKEGSVRLEFCRTEDQVADIFTKSLPRVKFEVLRDRLGMCSYSSKEEC